MCLNLIELVRTLLNNFCATTNNDANKVCTKNKKQAFMEFLFHEFLFEIEPHGPPSSVCVRGGSTVPNLLYLHCYRGNKVCTVLMH